MTTATTAERLLAWNPGHGLAPMEDPSSDIRLLVADSWLVRDGRVRGLTRHRERFLHACVDAGGPPLEQLTDFWRDMTAALPRGEGAWFPRVELVPGGRQLQLRLRLRAAPALAPGVRVWAAGQPDPRTVPRRKGPDLAVLARVRRLASISGRGAEEAVLTTPSGLVLEGATSSVLWWEDQTLCLPSPALPILAGVTTGLIQARAAQSGIRLVHRERSVEDLDGREVWLVNALHGIRPVTDWSGTGTGTGRPMRAGPASHAAEWRKWLQDIMEPLPTD
ncbi:aminotransferase class IV [Streptomyces sp. NPDC052236]|uniref:aminotransferase class IV n=1 Tax=Streptomyces sp. NPDC052236 TaxID=3365686 RepID=UPI0037D29379